MSKTNTENNPPDVVSGQMPHMSYNEVVARAQRILDVRGRPPYTRESFSLSLGFEGSFRSEITDDELGVLNDFMTYWNPFVVEKERPK